MIFFLKICQNIQEIFLSSSSASVSWVFVFKEIANTEAKIDKYRCFIILIHLVIKEGDAFSNAVPHKFWSRTDDNPALSQCLLMNRAYLYAAGLRAE